MSDASKVVYNWQSSAYMWNCIPCLLIMSPKGSMSIVNRIGPSTDPWGTPHTYDVGFDWVPLIRTDCDLSDKYDLNLFKAVPQIPSPDLSLSRSTSWSAVSKAALKSSIISNTLLLSSMALNMIQMYVNLKCPLLSVPTEKYSSSHSGLISLCETTSIQHQVMTGIEYRKSVVGLPSLIAMLMGLTWGPSGADRTEVSPMLTPWTLLSGITNRYTGPFEFTGDYL